tara:strand:- start:35 stop:193 length:159 start_codon:yes stop_codon:yes gene_type:complete
MKYVCSDSERDGQKTGYLQITSVIIGSVIFDILLPNPIIETTLAAYLSKWAT